MAAARALLYGAGRARQGARRRRRGAARAWQRPREAAPDRGSRQRTGPRRLIRLAPQGQTMTRRQRRLALIGSALGVLAIAVGLVLSALKDSIVFFNSPTDLVEKHVAPGARVRIGGLVKEGTVV